MINILTDYGINQKYLTCMGRNGILASVLVLCKFSVIVIYIA